MSAAALAHLRLHGRRDDLPPHVLVLPPVRLLLLALCPGDAPLSPALLSCMGSACLCHDLNGVTLYRSALPDQAVCICRPSGSMTTRASWC